MLQHACFGAQTLKHAVLRVTGQPSKTPPPPDPSPPRRPLTRHSTYIPHLLLNDRCPSSLGIPTIMIQENRLFTEWKWFGEDATRMMRGARVYACGRLHRLSSVRHVLGYVQHNKASTRDP